MAVLIDPLKGIGEGVFGGGHGLAPVQEMESLAALKNVADLRNEYEAADAPLAPGFLGI